MRNIKAPLHILKADGGSLPMEHMVSRPVETAFTGPAATVLGLSALGAIGNEHTVALDNWPVPLQIFLCGNKADR